MKLLLFCNSELHFSNKFSKNKGDLPNILARKNTQLTNNQYFNCL